MCVSDVYLSFFNNCKTFGFECSCSVNVDYTILLSQFCLDRKLTRPLHSIWESVWEILSKCHEPQWLVCLFKNFEPWYLKCKTIIILIYRFFSVIQAVSEVAMPWFTNSRNYILWYKTWYAYQCTNSCYNSVSIFKKKYLWSFSETWPDVHLG